MEGLKTNRGNFFEWSTLPLEDSCVAFSSILCQNAWQLLHSTFSPENAVAFLRLPPHRKHPLAPPGWFSSAGVSNIPVAANPFRIGHETECRSLKRVFDIPHSCALNT